MGARIGAESLSQMGVEELAAKLAEPVPAPWQLWEYIDQIGVSANPGAYGHQVFLAYMCEQSARGHKVRDDDLIVRAHAFLIGTRAGISFDEAQREVFGNNGQAISEASTALEALREFILRRPET